MYHIESSCILYFIPLTYTYDGGDPPDKKKKHDPNILWMRMMWKKRANMRIVRDTRTIHIPKSSSSLPSYNFLSVSPF